MRPSTVLISLPCSVDLVDESCRSLAEFVTSLSESTEISSGDRTTTLQFLAELAWMLKESRHVGRRFKIGISRLGPASVITVSSLPSPPPTSLGTSQKSSRRVGTQLSLQNLEDDPLSSQ